MFRILSLDGGGIRGAFTASVLATLEESTKKSIADHFDLITGTSTGGILALGLGLGFSATELRDFYQKNGPAIFPATTKITRAKGLLRQFFGPKLSQKPLKKALEEILGDRKFGESKCRLVIPTYDAIEGRIFILKTAHDKRFKYDIDIPAVDIALATSAAPTYFKAARVTSRTGAQYVDGGVWANNPVLVGLVEAAAFLEQPIDKIDILSIGTTTAPFNISEHENSGAAKWNIGLINLLMEGQAEAALAQAGLLLNGRLLRIDHIGRPGEYTLDDGRPEKIDRLIALGQGDAVKKAHLCEIEKRFLNGKHAQKFAPLYKPGA